MTAPDPWQALDKRFPRVKVYYRTMPNRWAQTIWPEAGPPFIEIAHDLGPIQQRCTLAHEYQHLVYGKPCASFCDANEAEVVEATARWLLPDLAALGAVLKHHDSKSAARLLEVTGRVLDERMTYLTDVEADELAGYLSPPLQTAEARAAHGPRRTPGRRPHHCRTTREPDAPATPLGQQNARPVLYNEAAADE